MGAPLTHDLGAAGDRIEGSWKAHPTGCQEGRTGCFSEGGGSGVVQRLREEGVELRAAGKPIPTDAKRAELAPFLKVMPGVTKKCSRSRI